MKREKISELTTNRLSVYLRCLHELAAAGIKTVSSQELAEQFNDREYLSLWNADLATILQEQGNLAGAEECVGRALTIGRAIHNAPCISVALVALAQAQAGDFKSALAAATSIPSTSTATPSK